MTDLVRLERQPEGVALLTFNRPEALNAFNVALQEEALQALAECTADGDVRVLVVAGAGRAFSSGFDLGAPEDDNVSPVERWKFHTDLAFEFVTSFWHLPKPVIAATHGYCLGGAFEVAMMCDLTVTAQTCQFGEPEIRLGYGSSGSVMLPFLVPVKIAREMLYTGGLIDAGRAYELGLVNAVVPDDRLMDEAIRRARVLSLVSTQSIRLAKEAVNFALEGAGALQALANNRNLIAILAGSGQPQMAEFRRHVDENGLGAALRWRRSQFEEVQRSPAGPSSDGHSGTSE